MFWVVLLGCQEIKGQTVIFSQNFESTTWTIPSTLSPAWSNDGSADNQWQMNTNTNGWTFPNFGEYFPTGANGTNKSARFHSYGASSGSTGSLISPTINFPASNCQNKNLSFNIINTNGVDKVNVYISTDGGTNWGSTIGTFGNYSNWTLININIGTTTSNNVKVKFVATSDWGFSDIGIDEIVITSNTIPSPITISPPSATICSGSSKTLTASGGSITSNVNYSSGSISLPIPDNDAAGATSLINISGIPAGATINDISVNFNIIHTYDSDLTINLKAPNGSVLNLVDRKGGNGNDFINTTVGSFFINSFSNSAAPFSGSYAPDASSTFGATGNIPSVTTFNNLYSTPNGNWTISALDDVTIDIGTILNWNITIYYTLATYTWTPSSSGLSAYSGSSVGASPTANQTYTVTSTINGCSNSTNVAVTVISKTIPTFTQVAAVCSGATINLSTTSINGITGTWSLTTNTTNAKTFTFTPTNGQCATTATMTVTVNPNVTPTFTAVAAICSGATINPLPTTSNNGVTGTWSPALNNTTSTTYTFTPTAGQCANTTTMTISLFPALISGSHNVNAITKCDGYNPSELTFTTDPSGGNIPYTYQWQNNTINIPSETTNTFDPPNLIVGSYSYRCKITDSCGNIVYTSPKVINIVSVPDAPSATKSPNTNSICEGTSLSLVNTTYGTQAGLSCGFEYQTSFDNGNSWTSSVPNCPTITATGTNVKIRIRVGSCGSGCDASSWSIYSWSVHSIPIVTISGNATICAGASTTLSATGANSYLWSNSLGTNSSINVTPSSNTQYTVTGTNSYNCTNNTSINVTVNPNPSTTLIYHQ